jgi:F-type H+-transporting ATPase subunit gamma
MSQLIQIRNRIKTIETTKKITHAMRLISMSTHAKVRTKEPMLNEYKQNLFTIFHALKRQVPKWTHPVFYPTTHYEKHLIIIVGSQKGLVGNFNTNVITLFAKELHNKKRVTINCIVIGKKAIEHMHSIFKNQRLAIITAYPEFGLHNFLSLANNIMYEITNAEKPYTTVTFYSNEAKSFFIQRAISSQVIPFLDEPTPPAPQEDYYWEQPPAEILDTLAQQCFEAQVQHLLFQSLLAEHAARFLSMDHATRNAKNLLDQTKLLYNKLRQYKITKELSEIASSF